MKKPPSPLRLARELRGLTLRQLRITTGIATGRLSMLERSMVSAKPAEQERLAAALQTSVTDIFPAATVSWLDTFLDDRQQQAADAVAVAVAVAR
jgi:transcriptional regulator with XRE-family HTH domain